MIRRILLLFAGLLTVQAAAVIVDVNLPYKELRLKDGMLFTDVAVRSINTSAGTVMLMVNKELVSVRTSMLPDEVTARLKDLAPAQTREEMEAEKLQDAADRKRAAENADRRQRRIEDEALAVRTASRTLNVKVAAEEAARVEAIPDEVAKFAESRARAYFRYQSDPHSNIGAVINSDIFLDNPEPVPGWGGRWRVEGVAYRQFINNQASGFGRGGQEFEMLIQTHDRKKPEIVEIRIK
jgi:hypothetical protein